MDPVRGSSSLVAKNKAKGPGDQHPKPSVHLSRRALICYAYGACYSGPSTSCSRRSQSRSHPTSRLSRYLRSRGHRRRNGIVRLTSVPAGRRCAEGIGRACDNIESGRVRSNPWRLCSDPEGPRATVGAGLPFWVSRPRTQEAIGWMTKGARRSP
jgi:hypothetical protein